MNTSPKTRQSSTRPRVLVFDSGVGGLSILEEIHRKLPEVDLIYACDNQAFPYGTKQAEELVQRVDKVLKSLFRSVSPDIVVVACNTASTVALPSIRAHFPNPVVGVVPAIKPAAAISNSRVIGLLGTPGTVTRPYTQELIDQFAADCEIVRVGSSELVLMAEQKLRGMTIDKDQLGKILAPLFNHPQLDTLILACTHFPLLKTELQEVAPRPLNWIDSGEAIARRVYSLIYHDQAVPFDHQPTGRIEFPCWLTTTAEDAGDLVQGLRAFGAASIHAIVLDPTEEAAKEAAENTARNDG